MPKSTGPRSARRSPGEGTITELRADAANPDKVTGFRGAIWLPRLDGTMQRKWVRGW